MKSTGPRLVLLLVTALCATPASAYTYFPVTGQLRGLTILVDFPDEPHVVPVEEVDRFLNEAGYAGFGMNGSVRDYFHDVSNGSLNYTNDVVGYYTTRHDKNYYENAGRIKPFIDEIFDWLENDYDYDFSALSVTGENDLHPPGTVRSVSIMYAGASKKLLFPRAYRRTANPYFTADGVNIGVFTISKLGVIAPDEFTGQNSAMMMYSYVHEAGHMIFRWFDLYHNNSNDLMGRYRAGKFARNPVPPNPYFRALRGWERPIDLASPTQSIKLIANSGESTYRYTNPENRAEHFYIEARAHKGRSAELGADAGVLVWYVNRKNVRAISLEKNLGARSGVISGIPWGNGKTSKLNLEYEISE